MIHAAPPGRRHFLGLALGLACTLDDRGEPNPPTLVDRGHGPCVGSVGAPEDLMRGHGVVDRLLVIYDEAAARIERHERVDVTAIESAALLVRRFVEDYHAMLEEQYVFPAFTGNATHTGLVDVLVRQHAAARKLTDHIIDICSLDRVDHEGLAIAMRAYTRMLRPHDAREDTVLLPAWRAITDREQLARLSDRFESIERARFGKDGLPQVVAHVAHLEGLLGVADLDRFTVE
jgi:hemerythrin-like domain-containing protein